MEGSMHDYYANNRDSKVQPGQLSDDHGEDSEDCYFSEEELNENKGKIVNKEEGDY
jgi:hypothetical protein